MTRGKVVLSNMHAYKQGMQIKDVKKAYQLDKIVKLASNENPYGHSDAVHEVLKHAGNGEYYPDGYASRLRQKLAEKLDVKEDQLVFGAGSDEVVTFICRAFLYEQTNTVMASPTFPQYRHHALIEGAEIKEVPVKDGKHDLEKMISAIDDRTKVVWICTPDNPTGTIITQSMFDQFMEKCPEDVIVVLDEAYYEYASKEGQLDIARNLNRYDNLIILRTLSKAYGIAGYRVGYGVSSEEISEKLNIVRGPFNVSALSQEIAAAVLGDDAFIEETTEKNKQVRISFEQFLKSINWSYYPSEANFLLVKTPIDADKAAEFLLTKGYIVRSGNLLGYPNTLRITMGRAEDMEELKTIIQNLNEQIQDGVLK